MRIQTRCESLEIYLSYVPNIDMTDGQTAGKIADTEVSLLYWKRANLSVKYLKSTTKEV